MPDDAVGYEPENGSRGSVLYFGSAQIRGSVRTHGGSAVAFGAMHAEKLSTRRDCVGIISQRIAFGTGLLRRSVEFAFSGNLFLPVSCVDPRRIPYFLPRVADRSKKQCRRCAQSS